MGNELTELRYKQLLAAKKIGLLNAILAGDIDPVTEEPIEGDVDSEPVTVVSKPIVKKKTLNTSLESKVLGKKQ